MGTMLALVSLASSLMLVAACSDSPTPRTTQVLASPTDARMPTLTAHKQSWGLFVIVGPETPSGIVMPDFGQGAIITGTVSGPSAAAQVAKAASRFADLPADVYTTLRSLGMDVQGA